MPAKPRYRASRVSLLAVINRVPRRRSRARPALLGGTSGGCAGGAPGWRGRGMANAFARPSGRHSCPRTRTGGFFFAALLRGERHQRGAGERAGARWKRRSPRRPMGGLQGLRGKPIRACPRTARSVAQWQSCPAQGAAWLAARASGSRWRLASSPRVSLKYGLATADTGSPGSRPSRRLGVTPSSPLKNELSFHEHHRPEHQWQ